MKKLNLLKSLIIVMAVLLSTGKAFCEATAGQSSRTVVQSTVAVELVSSAESGSIDVNNKGNAPLLTSTFHLKSNNEATFFIVYSSLQVNGENSMSAFDSKGNLLFGNLSRIPTETAVSNAKAGIAGNANVIVYPFKLKGVNVETSFVNSKDYNECYKVTLEDPLVIGDLNQEVGVQLPIDNTYGTDDEPGTYSATVYVTAATEL